MYIGLNAPKFETTTHRPTYLLTRVKSRDASASKNQWKGSNNFSVLAKGRQPRKELFAENMKT